MWHHWFATLLHVAALSKDNGDGQITLIEFIEGAARLRGGAKALDIWRSLDSTEDEISILFLLESPCECILFQMFQCVPVHEERTKVLKQSWRTDPAGWCGHSGNRVPILNIAGS